MSTLSSALAVLGSIFAGLLSNKYSPRKLLIAGLILHIFSSLGCGLTPSLSILFLSFASSGLALAIVGPMVSTLVGEHFTTEERPKVMGIIISAATLTFIFGSPIISYFASIGGWRLGFLAYYLPIVIIALLLNSNVIPVVEDKEKVNKGIFDGLLNVLLDNSARACLIGMALTSATYYSLFFYSISFFRVKFEVPLAWASLLVSAVNFISIGGTLSGGRFVNRYGRKTVAVSGCILAGGASILYVFSRTFWLALVIIFIGVFIAGLRVNAISSLSLEQVPLYRGSMMSLYSASMNIGSVLGAGIGGYTLLDGNWVLMGVSIGMMGILAAITLQLGANDPTK
jgi:predicted MFS family arabinose efflux permease